MDLQTSTLTREQAGELYPTLLTPRPVVLIGTWNDELGVANLAPYSSVSFVANHPPMLVVSFSRPKSAEQKDTLRLAEAAGEMVVNIVSRAQADLVVRAAEQAKDGEAADDYQRLGVERLSFGDYRAGRMAGAPAALGCKIVDTVDLQPSHCTLLIATIEQIYCSDEWTAAGPSAAVRNGLFASVAAENYVDLSAAGEFYLPRTWE